MNTNKPILLLEDDEVDAMTIGRALKKLRVTNRLHVAADGEQGLAYLMGDDHPRPCIILLDLNMPRMNGIEFLRIIKRNDQFKRIPVVVLTASAQERDRMESFGLGVAGYMVKPVHYDQFVDVIRTIDIYWTLSELPPD